MPGPAQLEPRDRLVVAGAAGSSMHVVAGRQATQQLDGIPGARVREVGQRAELGVDSAAALAHGVGALVDPCRRRRPRPAGCARAISPSVRPAGRTFARHRLRRRSRGPRAARRAGRRGGRRWPPRPACRRCRTGAAPQRLSARTRCLASAAGRTRRSAWRRRRCPAARPSRPASACSGRGRRPGPVGMPERLIWIASASVPVPLPSDST